MPQAAAGGASDRPIVNVVGELVALGPHRRDLLPTYQRWVNDFDTLRTLGTLGDVAPGPTTLEQEAAWYEGPDANEARFTIYERATWRPIGTTRLGGIDHRNRTATFGIVIGEADARGKGYGTETARLMLDYAFTALGLHSVMLVVAEFNLAGRRAYENAGFRECGRLWDAVYMDCLATEFASPVLSRVFVPDEPRPW